MHRVCPLSPLRANLPTRMHNSTKASRIAPSASGHGSQTAKPGRRRRAAESTNTPPKNQHFYFVDQNSSSKEKRAHVMRHHVQEKRKQRKMSHSTTPTEHIPDYISYPAKKEAETAEKTGLESRSTAAPNFTNGETSVRNSLSSSQVLRPQPRLDCLGVGLACKA